MGDLNGKKVLIPGGSSGIGLATAQALVAKGAEVVGGGRSLERIEQAMEVTNGAVRFVQLDVLDRDGMAQFFADEGPFDHLVNCATGGDRAVGPFLKMDLDGFEGSFRKLWGYVASVQLAAEHMNPDGSIVLIGGSPARKCPPGMSAISTVGNAVEGFCRAVALEIKPLRLNVVAPGFIDTPMFEHIPADMKNENTKNNVIPRPGTPEEVAHAVLMLLENDFITGTTVDVDGGALLP